MYTYLVIIVFCTRTYVSNRERKKAALRLPRAGCFIVPTTSHLSLYEYVCLRYLLLGKHFQ